MQEMWPKLQGLQWLHSSSAGLDHLLFHELIESEQVKVTNARGVYSHSLAEYALTCCSWFAKDLPRMRASQKAGKWDKYDVEELRGTKTTNELWTRVTQILHGVRVLHMPRAGALRCAMMTGGSLGVGMCCTAWRHLLHSTDGQAVLLVCIRARHTARAMRENDLSMRI